MKVSDLAAFMTILQTERLILRELEVADLDFVAAMLADPEVMRFWPRPYSRDEAVQWIARQQERYRSAGYGYWLALDRHSNEPVGQVGLLAQLVDGHERTGLGYIMHRPFWRRGYALEGAAACLRHGFALGNEEIIALIRPENTPSRGVAAKLGLVKTGRTLYADFDHLIYSTQRA